MISIIFNIFRNEDNLIIEFITILFSNNKLNLFKKWI